MQPWAGTIRLSHEDAETLVWLAHKLDPEALRGMAFNDVIRVSLRNERSRIETKLKKGKDNG